VLLIARLAISPALEIGLADVEVFDPAGKLARHYSGNATVRDGRAAFHIPFALNDAPGEWSVRGRDVVSDLTPERVRGVRHTSGKSAGSFKFADSRRRGW